MNVNPATFVIIGASATVAQRENLLGSSAVSDTTNQSPSPDVTKLAEKVWTVKLGIDGIIAILIGVALSVRWWSMDVFFEGSKTATSFGGVYSSTVCDFIGAQCTTTSVFADAEPLLQSGQICASICMIAALMSILRFTLRTICFSFCAGTGRSATTSLRISRRLAWRALWGDVLSVIFLMVGTIYFSLQIKSWVDQYVTGPGVTTNLVFDYGTYFAATAIVFACLSTIVTSYSLKVIFKLPVSGK